MKKTVIFSTIGMILWLIGLFIDVYSVVTGDANISLNFVVISLIRVMCIILPSVLLCVKKIDFKKKKMFSFMFLLILTVDMTVFTLFKYSFSVPKYSIKEIDFFETYFLPYLRWDTICSLFRNLTIILPLYVVLKENNILHSRDDVDYYTFVPARNCVMEIYTEGDTDTYGQLYCASGGLLDSDNNSNGNGNFKITAHLEAMKRYYIAVSHNSSTGYGDYTLRFKFVKDMLPAYSNPKGAIWINDSYDKDEVELSVQKIVYIDNQDSILWGYKLQQSTFINTIKIKAQQSIDELIEELILQGFSTSFAYNMAGYIIDVLEILQPSLNLAEFNLAYDSYVDSGCIGFVIAQCWTLKRMAVPPIPVYEYVEQQTYAHYDNDSYMYGYPYARGHFEC